MLRGPYTRRRRSLKRLVELEAQRAKLERTHPRKRGKKATKTRQLRKLGRRIAAAKGQLTRALRAIAQGAVEKKKARAAERQRRSAAAKRGWRKHKPRVETPPSSERIPRVWFLEQQGDEVKRIKVAPPLREDRVAIAKHRHAVGVFRENGSTELLKQFEGRSIYDALQNKRIRFVTDPILLLEAIASGVTDYDDLYCDWSWTDAA